MHMERIDLIFRNPGVLGCVSDTTDLMTKAAMFLHFLDCLNEVSVILFPLFCITQALSNAKGLRIFLMQMAIDEGN